MPKSKKQKREEAEARKRKVLVITTNQFEERVEIVYPYSQKIFNFFKRTIQGGTNFNKFSTLGDRF